MAVFTLQEDRLEIS